MRRLFLLWIEVIASRLGYRLIPTNFWEVPGTYWIGERPDLEKKRAQGQVAIWRVWLADNRGKLREIDLYASEDGIQRFGQAHWYSAKPVGEEFVYHLAFTETAAQKVRQAVLHDQVTLIQPMIGSSLLDSLT